MGCVQEVPVVEESQESENQETPSQPSPIDQTIVTKGVILKTAVRSGSDYILTFEIDSSVATPAGGHSTIINEINQSDYAKYAGQTRSIAGLDITKKQCFKIETRYTQISPNVFHRSNEICVDPYIAPPTPTPTPLTAKAPILESAVRSGDDYVLTFAMQAESLAPQGGYDTIINEQDQSDSRDYTGFSRTISGLDKSVKQCFKLEARYTSLSPNQFLRSNEVCVEAVVNNEPDGGSDLPSQITFYTNFETDQWGANGANPPAGNFWEVDHGLPRTTDHPDSILKSGRNGTGRAVWLGAYNNDSTRNELGRDNALSFNEHWMGVSVYIQNELDQARIIIQNRLLAPGSSSTVNAISLRQGEPETGKLYFSLPTDVNSVDTLPRNGAGSNTESVPFDYNKGEWVDIVLHYKGAFGADYKGPDTSKIASNIGFDPRSDGFIKIWVNGKLIVDHVGTTAYRYAKGGEEITGIITPKIGPYWSSGNTPRGDVYYDNYKLWVGPKGTFQDVDPSK